MSKSRLKWGLWLAGTAAVAATLYGCGGGGTGTGFVPVSNVRVFGDSLADSGTFGIKFTVNLAGDSSLAAKGQPTVIWPEKVASFAGKPVCNFFASSNSGVSFTTTASCGSFAVGGGRINNQASNGGPSAPTAIPFQMSTAFGVGTYSSSELVLIDGGGNDAADLLSKYLAAGAGGSGPADYLAFLGSNSNAVMSSTDVAATFSSPPASLVTAGTKYMTGLANKFADDITNSVLNKGAKRVIVFNVPDITLSPRFQAVLAQVSAANGGGSTGAAVSAAVQSSARSWIQTFNSTLSSRFSGNTSIAIIDAYTDFNAQIASPTTYGYASASSTPNPLTTPVCPQTGTDGSGLPSYNFATCTAAALDTAANPANWRQYIFADGFHPTPYGHQLFGEKVILTAVGRGWL